MTYDEITDLQVLLLWDLISSMMLFVLYGIDKRKAVKNSWRIPEKTLHFVALIGGWPGGLLGQKLFRHKTKKGSFRVLFLLTILINIVLQGVICYFLYGRGFH